MLKYLVSMYNYANTNSISWHRYIHVTFRENSQIQAGQLPALSTIKISLFYLQSLNLSCYYDKSYIARG